MIHGMLNLARVGKVIGDFAAVNLEELVGVIKTDLGELFRGKGAELRIVTPLPTIWGDSDRIGQLLANLIANGVKYNRSANPTIEVGAVDARDDGSTGNLINPGPNPAVTIFIRDNGIGIEPQFHAKIFQLFRRLHTHEEFEGTGVGLAICNKIVQAHGGRIWVESGLGAGATFFVRLQTQGSSASPAPSIATTESPARHDVALSQAKVDETNARRVSHFVD
jgi:light-regulated signal transduction histidine kinase (bacteriophytochrome)